MKVETLTSNRIDFEELEELIPLGNPEKGEEKEQKEIEINSIHVEDTEENEEQTETEESKTEPNLSGFDDGMVYDDMVKSYIKEGVWEDAVIDDEGTKLSEISGVSRDDFFKILKEQQKLQEEKDKENKYDISEFDEQQRKVVELMKSGASPSEMKSVFEFQDKFINPLSKFDLENEAHAAQLLRYSIKNSNPNLSDETVAYELKMLKSKGELLNEAQKVAEGINQAYNKKLTELKEQIEEDKKQKNTKHEEFIKKVNSFMNESKIKDTDRRAVRDFIRKDIEGKNLNNEIQNLKENNPEKLSKILLLMVNEKEFQRVYGTPKKDEASTVLKRINFSSKNSQKPEKRETGEEDKMFEGLEFIKV